MRDRIAVLAAVLVILVLATLGPGLIARRGQLIGCSRDLPGCPGEVDEKPFAYLADDGREVGPGDAQVAARDAADEELLAADVVPGRPGGAVSQFQPDQGDQRGVGAVRPRGRLSHARVSGAVTIRATRPPTGPA